MLFLENIKIALKALWSNKVRSALTMLGIIIGVFSVVILMGIGEGVRKGVSKQIQQLGSNIVTIVPGKIEEGQSFNPATTIGSTTLKNDDVSAIRDQVFEIEKISPLTLLGGVVSAGDVKSPTTMSLGVSEDFFAIVDDKLSEGRFFDKNDNEEKNKVAVIGYTTRKKLFNDNKALGEKIKVYNQDFEVIGVLEKEEEAASLGGMDFNNVAIIPYNTAVDITKNEQIFRIFAKAKSANQVDRAKDRIKEVMLAQHKGNDDFSVLTQKDLVSMFGSIMDLLTVMLSGIGAISLFVGGIGIMNIMLVSVTERTREIGIRKAIGATNFNILLQFLIEAITLSFWGGVFGLVLSFGAAFAIGKFTPISPDISLFSIILAVGVSLGVGIFFGLAPAIKASRKDPIEALRYE
ncbi:MAG: ABC transporter permease [Patescibacteria group bacterium]